MRKLQAVYEDGVLRPMEQLPLEEHQLVSVILVDVDTEDEEIQFEPPQRFEALADRGIGPEAVRNALSKIPGSLDADFAAERNELRKRRAARGRGRTRQLRSRRKWNTGR